MENKIKTNENMDEVRNENTNEKMDEWTNDKNKCKHE